MTEPIDPNLLAEAVRIANLAAEVTLFHYRHDELAIDRKGDGTPVTVADREAERLVRYELGQVFPDDGVLGEEEPEKLGTSGRRWIVDPIDGTKAFSRGVPTYTTLLAMEDADGIALGVIGVPAMGEVVSAGRGLGCFFNGAPTHVNQHAGLEGACISTSGFNPWDDDCLLRVKRSGVQLRTWGDGYGYVLVATGRIEAMFDPVAELYDLAPMPIILSEAGGRFTSVDGRDGPGHRSGVATNGLVHDDVLALLNG
ncbi:MAG: inositol monophosphatase family protein [Acidimicrobiales bacterium]